LPIGGADAERCRPTHQGGQSWGPDPLHAHTQTVSLTKLLAIQLLANAAHRNDVKSR